MSPHPSPDGTAARALRAADPTLRPNPTPISRFHRPRPQGAAAWLCRCLLTALLCVLLAACAPSGLCRCLLTALLCVLLAACAPSGSGPSGNSGPADAPRSLSDFALMTQDGQNGPGNASANAFATAFASASDKPVLRILYNASTKGTLHPCPS